MIENHPNKDLLNDLKEIANMDIDWDHKNDKANALRVLYDRRHDKEYVNDHRAFLGYRENIMYKLYGAV